MGKIVVIQKRNGKTVKFKTKDKGKPGKTPEEEKWYEPGVETGWKKDMPKTERRDMVLKAHKGDELASAKAMQALANVTTDRETQSAARGDALYFYSQHNAMKRREMRISPKTPKLR